MRSPAHEDVEAAVLTEMNLRSLRSPDGALEVLRQLGYDTETAKPYQLEDVGLSGVGTRLRRSQSRGYGVLIAEVDELPRSLKPLGRKLIEGFHDYPVAFLGVGNSGAWDRLALIRPRLVPGGGGVVTVARLEIDPSLPTAHDAEVLDQIAWQSERSDSENQAAIDRALDVERVTKRFFVGLRDHYERIVAAVGTAGEADPAVAAGLAQAQGEDRVALRVVTQTLFCYFLQRKGLLEGRRGWLSDRFRAERHTPGRFYAEVMEPLFYDALNAPQELRPEEWRKPGIPFLNGGLFERRYGDVSLPLEDELFSTEDGLLGFLDSWSFTVTEERADETEVAVDPEMLGKVFENLMAEDERRREGTIYTPRPVVMFMCREALVPYLQRECELSENQARLLLDADDPFGALADEVGAPESARLAASVDQAMEALTVIDPAVGSGAFPLGMLSELIRLRAAAHTIVSGGPPDQAEIRAWKLHAIERSLFGVDIRPEAIELCRLRMWLALLVDAEPDATPDPLPNLEYRTICADSLSDFVAGIEVQNTREELAFDVSGFDPNALVDLRERYFLTANADEKAALRAEISTVEDRLLGDVFELAAAHAEEESGSEAEQDAETIERLRSEFSGRDRVFPAFMPSFHAPDVAANGGWDVVIMNPPYVGRKELPGRLDAARVRDYERHFGRTADSMILFAWRALQLVRRGGALSMIFNDSIFTSADAQQLREMLLSSGAREETLHAAARTRCFEGVAVNGGVVIATRGHGPDPEVRWLENYRRPTSDLLAASLRADRDSVITVGESELFEVPTSELERLPHRPLFRPSDPARQLLGVYERCAAWDQFARPRAPRGEPSWELLSNTPGLNRWIADAGEAGFYEKLEPGSDFVLLGLVIAGGQGLATADDRRFLAAVAGTPEAEAAAQMCARLEELTLAHGDAATRYQDRRSAGEDAASALLTIADEFEVGRDGLGWPRGGLIRIAPQAEIRTEALTDQEVKAGITAGATFVPFEKGDTSGEEGRGARWSRDNPVVIDWSADSVARLRARAAGAARSRKPRLQNEKLWGRGGVTWNSLARYLRCREVPRGGIHGHMAPTIASQCEWLSQRALLALLNAPILDFGLRTFLGSLMHIEIGDIRRLPIPVLTTEQGTALESLADRAIAAATDGSAGTLAADLETELDELTRQFFGIDAATDLWVAR
jgi:hypothetical protein